MDDVSTVRALGLSMFSAGVLWALGRAWRHVLRLCVGVVRGREVVLEEGGVRGD